jgi:hypothetical protein
MLRVRHGYGPNHPLVLLVLRVLLAVRVLLVLLAVLAVRVRMLLVLRLSGATVGATRATMS